MGYWIFAVIIFFFWVMACVNVVREYERAVVYRLGRLQIDGHVDPFTCAGHRWHVQAVDDRESGSLC